MQRTVINRELKARKLVPNKNIAGKLKISLVFGT